MERVQASASRTAGATSVALGTVLFSDPAAPVRVRQELLSAAEAAGLFDIARSDGGHRRYSRDDLHRADRTRQLVDTGVRIDAAVRIVSLEYQLAAAHAMINILRRKGDPPKRGRRKE